MKDLRCAGASPVIRSWLALTVLFCNLISIACFDLSVMRTGFCRRWWSSGQGRMSQFWMLWRGRRSFFNVAVGTFGFCAGDISYVLCSLAVRALYLNRRPVAPPLKLLVRIFLSSGIADFMSYIGAVLRAALIWNMMNDTCSSMHVCWSLVPVWPLWIQSNCVTWGNRPGGIVISFAPCCERSLWRRCWCCWRPDIAIISLVGLSFAEAALPANLMYRCASVVSTLMRLMSPNCLPSSCGDSALSEYLCL